MAPNKQKLTLSVDSTTVDRAKELGINISELTEQILRGYAFDPNDLDSASERDHYLALLKTMDPLLAKYKTGVHVAELLAPPGSEDDTAEGPVRYCGKWGFAIELLDEPVPLGELDSGGYSVEFLKPDAILANFVSEIEQAKRRRKEEIGGILLAARIVEAISEADSKKKGVSPSRKPARPKRVGARRTKMERSPPASGRVAS